MSEKMSAAGEDATTTPEHKILSVDDVDVSCAGDTVTDDFKKMLQDPAVFAEALREVEQHRMDAQGQIGEFLNSLPHPVRKRIKALKKLQLNSVKLEAEFYKKVHELECEFAPQFALLHEKRKHIVSGQYEPTDEDARFPLIGGDMATLAGELEEMKLANGPESEKALAEPRGDSEPEKVVKGIPEFWLQLFRHVEILSDMIQENDEPILKNLVDVEMEMSKEPMGFTLKFHFAPNHYFTNGFLTKAYFLKCQPDDSDPFEFDGPEIVGCKGCSIDWKPGKNVTVKLIKKKQKHKQRGQTRFVTKQVKTDSFFNFFDPPDVPADGPEACDDETKELLNADFEIGQILRDRVVPRAVLFFTGEAEDDSMSEDDEDEELDSEDNEDEEVEDDDGGHALP